MAETLSVSLQENLLVLLTFNPQASSLIRNSVPSKYFSSQQYRDIAERIYAYQDQFKKPPGDHLPDMFEDELRSKEAKHAPYQDIFAAIGEQRDRVNEAYILGQLEAFVRQQSLKSSIISASEAIQEGDLDKAEVVLQDGLKTRIQAFVPGINLTEGIRSIYNKSIRQNVLPLGIPELDKWDLGPAAGEFHLFIGPPKRGKTWWLVHVAKRALIHRMKVLVVTLELSEGQWAQRLIQSLFSMNRRAAEVPITRLVSDDLGRLLRFERDKLTGRLSLDDHATRPAVEKRLARMHGTENLMIKQFPAGQLTVKGLEAYLDMLERATRFIPDVIVIDYPDYMKINANNYRLELGAVYNDLRGVAVSRHAAVVVASKSNKEGAEAKLMKGTHAGEDYSKIYTADTIMTYSQTLPEKDLGLARLFVESTRVAERDGFIVLLSQAYPVGQFCLSSTLMLDRYWGLLEQTQAAAAADKGDDDD